ncbi:hypothetical protein ACFO25_10890 [Paenactinomyces guangxiensis]|uniref:Membrane protein YkvI n=1 Tax=Paenactinomyces guangxiensis TaxID=1490290 RepID=A0A7W1WQJ1_9BACL|nr:hypothetical protein [Paenactinomyces guangxiensis]MBA4494098.1 hypothetical protein [Paenactinomyces guangxiensis]MBH8591157.1 hypothetical protein [Paenactinomyces guangxiensis]
MRFSLWQSFKIGMTIVGTTIGAGFASGREIWEFFGSYGETSHYNIILSMCVFFFATIILLTISWQKKTNHYSEVLEQIMGPYLTRLFDWIVLFFLLSTTVVMIAGSGAAFVQWKGDDSFILGCIIMMIAVFVVLLFDLKGLMSMNILIIPLLIIILLIVCVWFLQVHPGDYDMARTNSHLPAWPSAISYAAFNIISLLAVLSTMGSQIQHHLEIWLAAAFSMVCLGGIAILYNYSLLKIEHLMSQYEIPLFALVEDYSPFWVSLITCVLWFAIYTTAISNVYGLVFRLNSLVSWPRWMIGLISLLVLAPLSQFGFTNLVQFLYPLYGVINLFILASILLYPFSQSHHSTQKK